MILTIDIGNSATNFGIFEDDKLILQFRRTSDINSSSDEIGIFMRSVLRENGFDWKAIKRIGCCSVVPSSNYSMASACKKYFDKDALFIQAGIKTGLKLKYSNTKEIGADLIAAAIGAISLFPDRELIIVDMGTATTVELVSKQKEFLGGAILPGLKISAEALALKTANLPSVEIAKPAHISGSTTSEAIQTGLYYGHAGAIKEVCDLYQKEIFGGTKPYIIGTGGFSKLFSDYCLFDKIVPHLVLQGVKCAVEMN